MAGTAWARELESRLSARDDLGTWQGHAALRHREMSTIDEIAGFAKVQTIVEVGCGNGFGSAYLADRADLVAACDLPGVSVRDHAIGLQAATRLFEAVDAKACVAVGCTGEALPFGDATVDTVLALYSLEHVPDRQMALQEIRRILRPGGSLIAAVPAAAWSLHYPLDVYADGLRRALRRPASGSIDESHGPAAAVRTDEAVNGAAPLGLLKRLRRSHPHFPLPTPHGAYASYAQELLAQRPSRWVAMFEQSGLRVVTAAPVSVVPCALLETIVGPKAGMRAFLGLGELDRRMCRHRWARPFAQFLCVVCRKDGR